MGQAMDDHGWVVFGGIIFFWGCCFCWLLYRCIWPGAIVLFLCITTAVSVLICKKSSNTVDKRQCMRGGESITTRTWFWRQATATAVVIWLQGGLVGSDSVWDRRKKKAQ